LPNRSHDVDVAYRVGAAVLSMAAGAALGLLVGTVLLFAGVGRSLSSAIASGAIAGGAAGALFPIGAMDFVEGTVHFFIGFFSTGSRMSLDTILDAEDLPSFNSQQPAWLRWAFMFGIVFAVAVWVLGAW